MKREGQDIISNVPISFVQAILGSTIEIETVDGPKEVTIEPGSQTNDELTLSKLGAWEFNPSENYDSQELRGDHKVILQVQFPKEKELSEKQVEILKEWSEIEKANMEKFYPGWTPERGFTK